jgi:glycosyltransferase involved in cell wall biosynthesis
MGEIIMHDYLISIVIPTKNRYKYLFGCLDSLVTLNAGLVEVVIQDNSEENAAILKHLASLERPNFKYFHNKHSLSVSDNSDLAIKNSCGKYVCFIGDDDSVLKVIEDVVTLLDRNDIDACNVNMAGYHWDDIDLSSDWRSYLTFDKRNLDVELVNTGAILREYLSGGMQTLKLLPRVYHGILSRRVLNRIYVKNKTFFPGPSPDMANACAAALELESHLYIKFPIVVSGAGYDSVAGKSIRGKHKGNLQDVSHLGENVLSIWDSNVPKFWLAYTIWPVSALGVIRKSELGEVLYKKMNFSPMYARIILKHPEYIRHIRVHVTNIRDVASVTMHAAKEVYSWILRRSIVRVKKWFQMEYFSDNEMSLVEACKIVNAHNDSLFDISIADEKIKRAKQNSEV